MKINTKKVQEIGVTIRWETGWNLRAEAVWFYVGPEWLETISRIAKPKEKES